LGTIDIDEPHRALSNLPINAGLQFLTNF
jgi:hypothetical protein